ncbi:MAG: hypothetical protein J6125_01060, partial [Clostridia bacterium]|nr:hypothetical protein [Clostridia bacterium]
SLSQKAKEKEQEIARLDAALAENDRSLSESRQTARDAEQNKELLYTMSRAGFAAYDQAAAKAEANQKMIQNLRADADDFEASRRHSESERDALTKKLTELEAQIEAARHAREQHAVSRNAIDDERAEKTEEINRLSLAITEVAKDVEALEGQIRTALERTPHLDAEIGEMRARIAAHEDKIAEQEKYRALCLTEKEDVEADLDEVRGSRQALQEGVDDSARLVSELREKIKKKNEEKELCVKTNANFETRLENLLEEQERTGSHLYEEYELTYEQAVALDYPPVTRENRAATVQALTSARNRLRAMGSVNPNAVEEYNELKARYDAMDVQLRDLRRAKEELLDVIDRLENEMKVKFVGAFEQINLHFNEVFRELFGGGEAHLELTDPEDVLGCGIEISVTPPGKTIKKMSLLSGGEQSFIAIALFFAIIKVNPTPFCILDEVEAALDEVNVSRFGAYIRKMSPECQFILISHRRGTMEIADRLYGVTMPEKGISRVIGVDLSEIAHMQQELKLDEIS